MAVPKKKTAKSYSRTRTTAWRSKQGKKLTGAANTVTCPKCKEMKLPHIVCSVCGEYRGRQVLNTVEKAASKAAAKVTKLKADK